MAADDAWILRNTNTSQRRWSLQHLHRRGRAQRPASSISLV
jgi:hypothetical protein